MKSASTPLEEFSELYEILRSDWNQSGAENPEWVLACVEQAAEFAGIHHTGRFADGALDNTVLRIGQDIHRLDVSVPRITRSERKRRVLHVTTRVYGVGGHTRTIKQWMRLDRSSQHILAITDQGEWPIPTWLITALEGDNQLFDLSVGGPDRRSRAKVLRSIASDFADVVILHTFSGETIPIMSFAAEGGPPVVVLNQADDRFWIGSSIADGVIHQREQGRQLSSRRFLDREVVLPIPLGAPVVISRQAARTTLGLSQDELVLLTVGRGEKFRPTSTSNFFRTAFKLLAENESAHLYVIGLDEHELQHDLRIDPHPRIHPCGSLQDPSLFQAAADLFLEPFPFGSATATLETALRGTPIVLAPDPIHELLVTNHGLNSLVQNALDEESYLQHVCSLCRDRDARESLGAQLQEKVRAGHTGEFWIAQLESLYDNILNWPHRPRSIPITACCDSDMDHKLAEWHAFSNKQEDLTTMRCDRTWEASYLFRQQGNYAASLTYLLRAAKYGCFEPRFLKALAKLPLHYVARRMNVLPSLKS